MKRISALWIGFFIVLWTAPLVVNAATDASDPYQAGLRALRAGKTEQAIEFLSQAINSRPNDHRYYNDRGVAYKRSGNHEMALADYTKSLQLKSDYTNALNNRGVLYLEQGGYDKALQDFTEAVKHGGLESKVFTNLGIVRSKMGDHRGAVADFEKAVSSKPVDTRAYSHFGEALEQLGERDRALKMYKVAAGMISDQVSKDEIEKRIFQLEKGRSPKPLHAAVDRNRLDSPNRRSGQQQSAVPQAQTPLKESATLRTVVRASPPPDASLILKKIGPTEYRIKAATLDELDEHCRTKAMSKLSSNAVEIFRQGMDFVGKGDLNKALIRFEDTRQLEKRTKNIYGFAWSSLETAKLHLRLGDQTRANLYFQEALQNFSKAKAVDETILTLVELASSQKTGGQKEKAAAFFAKAAEEAGAAGSLSLAKDIEELAAGKKPALEKRRVAAEQQRQKDKIKVAARSDDLQPKPVITVPDHGAKVAPADSKAAPGRAQPQRKPAPVPDSAAVGQKPQQGPPSDEKLDNVGRGPALGVNAAKPGLTSTANERVRGESRKPETTGFSTQPERVVLWANGAQPSKAPNKAGGQEGVEPSGAGKFPKAATVASSSQGRSAAEQARLRDKSSGEKLIRQDLAELKRLKSAKDEPGMVAVLERLAGRYSQAGHYEKALYGLSASLAFREKLGLQTGKKTILYQSGLMQQRLGNSAEALEALTRAMSIPGDMKDRDINKELASAAQEAAKRQGLPVEDALHTFAGLWKSRSDGNSSGETQALYLLAGIYEKADKPAEALNYYERAGASILADKSRVYGKMGKTELAEQTLAQALEAFRKLDYSRYVNIMRKSKSNSTLSQFYRSPR